MSTENALLTILIDRINNDSLILPTLPQAALKVRQVADDPDATLSQMSMVISQDPALAARMIKVANSAFLGRSVKVNSLNQAITRIGLRQIKNIATAMAMEQLFVSKNKLIKTYVDKAWQKTLKVATQAITSMHFYVKDTQGSKLHKETITLAALVFNIGVLPILTEAEKHPEVFANPRFLDHAIQKLSGRIGGLLLKKWEFTDEFVEIAQKWADPMFQPNTPSYIDFIRIGAIIEGVMPISDKVSSLRVYEEQHVISSVEMLSSDEYLDMLESVKSIFN